jgi:hypothetical protein
VQAHGLYQLFDGFPHPGIVIDDEYGGRISHAHDAFYTTKPQGTWSGPGNCSSIIETLSTWNVYPGIGDRMRLAGRVMLLPKREAWPSRT